MSVVMESLVTHSLYDPTGTRLLIHPAGERYTLEGGGGLTADHLANRFEVLGLAKRVALDELDELPPRSSSSKSKPSKSKA